MNCYNCGIELTDETNHVEHIPAKNLFKTYPPEYKKELLTVPACYDCNIGLYSKIDQEIRDAIGILNENDDLKEEMTAKAVRSIMRKSNWKERVFSIEGGKSFEISFSYNDIEKLHIKNFKGLFYSKYGKSISEEYQIRTIAEGDEENEKLQKVKGYFREYIDYETDWSNIGHPTVFQYKIKAMIPGENDMFYDGENIEDAIGFVCTMEYHGLLKPLVIAQSNEIINKK
ncbi:hypothetical protein GCM10011506_04640 [Marivirga lumbricoides]|uniref:HNH endonuclease n=1 Tax=Marivirga lumbricoides TaxID=1046115 RepID=A0ABQ1LE75_9BACT|nr:hypothetical protein GCM10011506_04640 [Marivirga lumbricoides]